MPTNSYSQKFDISKSQELKNKLSNFSFEEAAHALWRAKGSGVTVTLYKSGKILVQGTGTENFIHEYLGQNVEKQTTLNLPTEKNDKIEHSFTSWIGTDESGKGDYFGPLIIASVAITPKNQEILGNLGIKDSKKLDDKQIAQLAIKIKQNSLFSIVTITPKKYNEIYKSFNNLNKLLAWGHARAIENILEKAPDGSIKNAISDKFGDESFIKNALMKNGKNINLIQRVRAESDLAVASASVLARDEFVKRIDKLSSEFGISLPKGASSLVLEAAKEFVNKHGKSQLNRVAKLHFKTTKEIL